MAEIDEELGDAASLVLGSSLEFYGHACIISRRQRVKIHVLDLFLFSLPGSLSHLVIYLHTMYIVPQP
jgi:hypothetical protein